MTPPHPRLLLLAALIALAALPTVATTTAQQLDDSACGVVDGILYPVDVIRESGDDFGIYRAKFGGLHTGVDVAFYRYGDPIYAIARGRVTYADPEGWDTEKGVVILEHTFPDGSIVYSVYGHMEPINNYPFPEVGQCVPAGAIVGAVGSPSLSAPHLHFEIRTFGPDDGGPGYWDTNPLEAGWLHPLDFIRLWQLRLQEALYRGHVTGTHAATLPPLTTSDGGLIVASASQLEGLGADGAIRWRLALSGTVIGMVALPDSTGADRVLLAMAEGGVLVMANGRTQAMWTPTEEIAAGPLLMGEAVVFLTEDNALAAYTPEGDPLWTTPPLGARIADVLPLPDRIAVGTRPTTTDTGSPAWHVIGAGGGALYQVAPANPPQATAGPDGDFYLLDGATLYHISADFTPTALTRLPYTPGRSTALATNTAGHVYVFLALDENHLYAYDTTGEQRWEATLPGTHRQPPLLAAGRDRLYVLGVDGTLHAVALADGALLGSTRLYAGGANGHPNARVLAVLPGATDDEEIVYFGAGYLSVAWINGLAIE